VKEAATTIMAQKSTGSYTVSLFTQEPVPNLSKQHPKILIRRERQMPIRMPMSI